MTMIYLCMICLSLQSLDKSIRENKTKWFAADTQQQQKTQRSFRTRHASLLPPGRMRDVTHLCWLFVVSFWVHFTSLHGSKYFTIMTLRGLFFVSLIHFARFLALLYVRFVCVLWTHFPWRFEAPLIPPSRIHAKTEQSIGLLSEMGQS